MTTRSQSHGHDDVLRAVVPGLDGAPLDAVTTTVRTSRSVDVILSGGDVVLTVENTHDGYVRISTCTDEGVDRVVPPMTLGEFRSVTAQLGNMACTWEREEDDQDTAEWRKHPPATPRDTPIEPSDPLPPVIKDSSTSPVFNPKGFG
jgi:hypothetical protein